MPTDPRTDAEAVEGRKPTYPVNIAIAEECLGTFKHLRRKWLGDNEDEAMRQAMEHALEGWEPPMPKLDGDPLDPTPLARLRQGDNDAE